MLNECTGLIQGYIQLRLYLPYTILFSPHSAIVTTLTVGIYSCPRTSFPSHRWIVVADDDFCWSTDVRSFGVCFEHPFPKRGDGILPDKRCAVAPDLYEVF